MVPSKNNGLTKTDENATNGANLKEMRAAESQMEIEIVGERLRKACGLQKDD